MAPSRPLRPETVAVNAGRGGPRPGAPLNVPLVFASSYRAENGVPGYVRDDGTPTWSAFQEALGALDGGDCLVFSSGMAAVAAVLDAVPDGVPVVAPRCSYVGSRQLLSDRAARGRGETRLVDTADTEATVAACRGAGLLWLETPANPLLDIADIAALAEGAHAAGCEVVVDSTFATPILQRPLDLGADLVMHSVTKYIGGHSDLLLGAVVGRDAGRMAAVAHARETSGGIAGQMETWLALRGLRTLPVRLRQASANAAELARRLAEHPRVERVRYPGLVTHPQHELAARQMRGFGAMVSFEVVGGAAAADAVCGRLEVITHATSLGGVESSLERRERIPGEGHVPVGLLRFSVGCEDVEDLWEDLVTALG